VFLASTGCCHNIYSIYKLLSQHLQAGNRKDYLLINKPIHNSYQHNKAIQKLSLVGSILVNAHHRIQLIAMASTVERISVD
jgi:hypothetical protein